MGTNVYGTGAVFQRKDGRWVAKIYVDGKPKTRYAKTEKDAWRAVKTLWQDMARGTDTRPIPADYATASERPVQTSNSFTKPGASQTVRDFAEEWLSSSSLKATTEQSYRNNLKAHVFPVLGERRLDDVTASDVASLIATVQKSGASERTAQYAYSLIRRLFQVATDWEILPTNPAARVKRPQVHREEKEVRTYAVAGRMYQGWAR